KNTFTVFDPVLDENVTMVGPASLSGMLDRDESTPRIALTWQALPDTTVRAGYRYSMIKYTGYEVIGGPKAEAPRAPGTVISSDRTVNSHTIFLGLDHQFNPNFYGSVEAGGSYYDYYRINETSWGPYARLSLTDMYMPESSVTVGFQESRSPSDQLGLPTSKTDIVRDQETSTLFANVRQRIMPKFFANLNGSFQNGTF